MEPKRENLPYVTTNYGAISKERLGSAFTVAELGVLMGRMLVMTFPIPDQQIGYQCDLEDATSFTADTEADARAKMLVYLLERGLVSNENNQKIQGLE